MARVRHRAVEANHPVWHEVMKTITGLTETPGDPDNPKIMGMIRFIAWRWREVEGMQEYCNGYTHDSVPWCGLCEAFCMSVAGIMPPFDKDDETNSFLWALAWANDPRYQRLANPRPGCVAVMEREGGGHVTTYEADAGSSISCRGGNQSDSVNVSEYSKDGVVAYIWPRAGGPIPPAERRELSKGDTGSDVTEVQLILGIPSDGEFGPTTEGAVMGFQAGVGVHPDGVVGAQTWEMLDSLQERKDASSEGLTNKEITDIVAWASDSPLMTMDWPGRGRAPEGYITGMALTYGLALKMLAAGDTAVEIMAATDSGDEEHDALTWYADEFREMGWSNDNSGVETLRHLFNLLIGLGMRESSGEYYCGVDTSAGSSSQTGDTAEAGLFQTSWNIRNAASEFVDLFDHFDENPNGFLNHFRKGVTPTGSDLKNIGDPDGATYQFLAKYAPAFAVLTTALGMRLLRQHWGPINRKEIDPALTNEADELLSGIETIIDQKPEPAPEPDGIKITVVVPPGVTVDVVIDE
jgi:uncharacterized protein (TIGR02594 family)